MFGKVPQQAVVKTPVRAAYNCLWRRLTASLFSYEGQLRTMDFHPLPERRLILYVRGEVEIGVSDGRTPIFRPGDARLREDTSGRGHTHRDLSPVIQAVVVLKD